MTTLEVVHLADLEPSLVGAHTYVTRRRRTRLDVAAMLSTMICLLYLIPGMLTVPTLTYAGRPALLLALALFAWWVLTRLNHRLAMTGPQPVRWALFAMFIGTLLAYLGGVVRGLPTLEWNAQNFALLQFLQFAGIVLATADGIPNWERLTGVLRVLVWCAGFMASVGIVQSVFKFNLADYLVVPGLSVNSGVVGFATRGAGGFFRVAGTASHYIEFSAVLAIAVPFAIHFARFSAERRHRRAATAVAFLLVTGLPMSISRTGIVALAAGVVVMMVLGWGWRMRFNILVLAAVVCAGLMAVRPGLLGTVRYTFVGANQDPSISGRTDDYAIVGHFFAQRPWLGRGPNTLVPVLYNGLVLDNQWLYTLVTQGLVGVAVFAAMHLTCLCLAAIALRRARTEEVRHLCVALIATMVVAMLVAGTVDELWFTTFAATVFLLMGACGTVWRLTHGARTIRTSTVSRIDD